MSRMIDITGQRFGRLVALRVVRKVGGGTWWRCLCDCGYTHDVRGDYLRNGHSRSCGCLQKEIASHTHKRHGRRNSPEYHCWHSMLDRCRNNKRLDYRYYGGRGISVCKRWRKSIAAFIADVGPRPSPSHTIDRINPNGNYEPGNVRWATKREQSLNRRCVTQIAHGGHSLTVRQWSERIGWHPDTIWWRLRHGWPVELALRPKALTTPEKEEK